MKPLLYTTIAAFTLSAGAALAEMPNLKDMSPEERRAAIENMTPEQREKFKAARQEKWQGMSQDEKLKVIEERREEMLQKREEKWNSMSADEKIKKAEEMMQKRKGKRGE